MLSFFLYKKRFVAKKLISSKILILPYFQEKLPLDRVSSQNCWMHFWANLKNRLSILLPRDLFLMKAFHCHPRIFIFLATNYFPKKNKKVQSRSNQDWFVVFPLPKVSRRKFQNSAETPKLFSAVQTNYKAFKN